jgi:hypothetical protein
MTNVDISAEAVERLIAGANGIPAFAPHNDTLRALLAERDRLRAEQNLLQEALQQIVQQCFDHEGRANIAATALAALKETGHD